GRQRHLQAVVSTSGGHFICSTRAEPLIVSRPAGAVRTLRNAFMQRVRLTCSTYFAALLVAASLAASSAPANAQTGAASITGILTDQSGAALAGVIVVALNGATLVASSAVSNEAGVYT